MPPAPRITAQEAMERTRLAIIEQQEQEAARQARALEEEAQLRAAREQHAANYVAGHIRGNIEVIDRTIDLRIRSGESSVEHHERVEVARPVHDARQIVEMVAPLDPGHVEERTLCALGILQALRANYENSGYVVTDLRLPNETVTVYGSGSDPMDIEHDVANLYGIRISWGDPSLAATDGM